jgi:hypothetical protein
MTDARPAERRRRLRPPPPTGFIVLWLTLLLLVLAGLHVGTAQEPTDAGVRASRDTAAVRPGVEPVPSAQPETVPDAGGQVRVELAGTRWWERLTSASASWS